MSDGAFESYLGHWREADPGRSVAWLFVRPDERIRFGAWGALQEEWLEVLREVGEPQVAAAKLGWWRDELQRSVHGEARHPLTQALFVDARVREVPGACWTEAVEAALFAIGMPPAGDFPAQYVSARPLAKAFAALETRMGFDPRAATEKAAAVIALGHLTANLRALGSEVGRGRSPLPMNLLARHGLVTESLANDGPARRAALRDYVGDLVHALADAAAMQGPLTLFRGVQLQHDLRSLRAAERGEDEDPLRGLLVRRNGFRELLKIWRAARISRRYMSHENSDATT